MATRLMKKTSLKLLLSKASEIVQFKTMILLWLPSHIPYKKFPLFVSNYVSKLEAYTKNDEGSFIYFFVYNYNSASVCVSIFFSKVKDPLLLERFWYKEINVYYRPVYHTITGVSYCRAYRMDDDNQNKVLTANFRRCGEKYQYIQSLVGSGLLYGFRPVELFPNEIHDFKLKLPEYKFKKSKSRLLPKNFIIEPATVVESKENKDYFSGIVLKDLFHASVKQDDKSNKKDT